jgi:hypothetical protein
MTARSDTTTTVSKTRASFASCSSDRTYAVQAMEFVSPDPAECCTRYFGPGPSFSTPACT